MDEHRIDADRLAEDWERALDTASAAVSLCSRSKLLTPAFSAREDELIRAERNWLAAVTPVLRKLFPPASSAMMTRHQPSAAPPRAAQRPAHRRGMVRRPVRAAVRGRG